MNLSEHFTLEEFTASSTAARRGIDNSLPAEHMIAAKDACYLMERIRAFLSSRAGRPVPIFITSGYRCPALNAAIGSSSTSDHLKARAVDFKAPGFGTPHEVAAALAPVVDELQIGQLIAEFGSWVHVSTRRPDKLVNRILTIDSAGTRAGIQQVRR